MRDLSSSGRRLQRPGRGRLLLWAACATAISTGKIGQGSRALAAVVPQAVQVPAQNTITYDAANQRYELVSQGTARVVYRIQLGDEDIQQGMLKVTAALDRGPFHVILEKAGTRYRTAAGQLQQPETYAPTAGATLLEHSIQGDELVLHFTEQPGSHVLEKTYRLRLVGQSLQIRFSSPATWGLDGYAGLSLGHMGPEPGARVVDIPLLPVPLVLLGDGSVLSAYLDPTVSSASDMLFLEGIDASGNIFAHAVSTIRPNTAGDCLALAETAYVTLAADLDAAFPATDHDASPYRASLSDRLVLDVWGLHHNFGVPEGVAYQWQSPESGQAHLTLHSSDENPSCGDGVVVTLWKEKQTLVRLVLPNGTVQDQVWTGDVSLSSGDHLSASIDRRGNNACDGTNLRLTIDIGANRYDSTDDFSSIQGQNGWSYLEFQADRQIPMTWDEVNQRWQGSTNYSFLWPGGGHPGQGATGFLDAESMVRRYAEYGLTHLAVIFHVWQHWGYDAGLPDHYPANPSMGTDQDMADFVARAKAEGMLVALHENYTDMYPDNQPSHPSPLWDPTALALDPNGTPRKAWYNEGTGQQAYRIAADRMQGFAEQQDQLIASAYGPNASYLDVTTGWNPAMAIDYDAGKNTVPSLAHGYERMTSLFDAMRSAYAGPLFGEGGEGPRRFDSFFAGWVDGVERQIEGRWNSLVAPDYELTSIKPSMLNHGMGYYARYFSDQPHQLPNVAQIDMDRYRATELAYGHAGFLGDGLLGDPSWMDLHVPEYWLVQAVQSRYANADVTEVAYWDGTGFLDLESALKADLPLRRAKVQITYDNGLVLWINRDSNRQRSASTQDFSHEQGAGGWSYYEDLGNGLVPMHWDPAQGRWQGSGRYSFLTKWGGHPQGGASVRVFTAPDDADYHVSGTFADSNTSCGDGIRAVLATNGTILWQCRLPEDGTCNMNQDVGLSAGQQLQFRIEPRANNLCDSTTFSAQVSWTASDDRDWVVDSSNGPLRLPPSGFLAEAPGLVAWTARLGQSPDDAVGDRVQASTYEFARSRNGFAAVGGITTDGAIALVPGTNGDDIHGLALTQAVGPAPNHDIIVSATQRCDINLRILDRHRALLVLRRPLDPTMNVNLTLGRLPPEWKDILAQNSQALTLVESDMDGNALGQPSTVPLDSQGNAVIDDLAADRPYLLQMDLSCSGPDCCGNGICNDNENCSTCPADCGPSEYQVCCDGQLHSGECCQDSDCNGGYCVDYTCLWPTDDLVPNWDAGSSGDASDGSGAQGGCNCQAGGTSSSGLVPSVLVLFFLLVLSIVSRKRLLP